MNVTDERCPSCGGMPDDDTIHQEGCERLNTCGQYGPPWIPAPWHTDEVLAPRNHFARYEDWDDHATRWMRAVAAHRTAVHPDVRDDYESGFEGWV